MALKIPNLDKLTQDNPLLGEALQSLMNGIEQTGTKLSVNPQGNTNPPAAPTGISVTANASGIHRVSISDNSPRTRNVHYFVEHSTDRHFSASSVQVEHLGPVRQRSLAQSMGTTPVYYRAYAQYLDGPRSDYVYFGSSTNPTGVQDGATTVGPAFHASTGSGTASGGGEGFGTEKYVANPAAPGRPPKVFSE